MEHDAIQFDSPLPIVEAWQDAANRHDIGRLLELSDPEIEVAGPKGSGRGHELLREWLERSGLTLRTLRAFVKGESVVLAQHGVWPSQSPEGAATEAAVASLYKVNDGRVTHYARYDDLGRVLADAGLDASDEMKDF